jgi:glycosyltransferase involved in cell wall biosynthesis
VRAGDGKRDNDAKPLGSLCTMKTSGREATLTGIRSAAEPPLSYVLITPARNESAFIGQTIESVIRQTVLPLKWVIVSDGSTDGTDDIVKTHAEVCPWIKLVRMPERRERHFAGKVHAFNAGWTEVRDLEYRVIGNLDADITFEEDYIAYLLQQFRDDPRLGVAGTPFREESQQYDYRFTSLDHVSGACQLFRRECFEEIGGYTPLKAGGVDLAAVLTARMMGWQTRTFTGKICEHHKKTQSGSHSNLRAAFRSGYHDYLMGSHPLWQFSRSAYQMTKKPLVALGASLLAGYFWALVTRTERILSRGVVEFRQKEQMRRLREYAKKGFPTTRQGNSA